MLYLDKMMSIFHTSLILPFIWPRGEILHKKFPVLTGRVKRFSPILGMLPPEPVDWSRNTKLSYKLFPYSIIAIPLNDRFYGSQSALGLWKEEEEQE